MAAQGWVLGGKHRGRARRPGRMGVSLPPTNLWAGMFAKAVTPPPPPHAIGRDSVQGVRGWDGASAPANSLPSGTQEVQRGEGA